MHQQLEHTLAGVTDAMLAQATAFLEARRAKHGDLRMEADPDSDPNGDLPPGDGPDNGDDSDATDQLGDPGKQALDRMKQQRNQFRDELRQFQALGLTPEQIRTLSDKGKDDQPDPEQIRQQARAEARAEALRERVVDKIEARAAKQFADPEDAVAILLRSRKADEFLDGDSIDAAEIDDALKDLLAKKPHLAAAPQRRFTGGGDQGPRDTNPPRAKTLTEAVVARVNAGKTTR